jgi:hypothetical protein
MSEYQYVVNFDKNEYLCGLDIMEEGKGYAPGIKLSSIFYPNVFPALVAFMISDTGAYGKQRWAGHRIIVAGEYGEHRDIYEAINRPLLISHFSNITKEAIEAWNKAEMSPKLVHRPKYPEE